MNDRLLPRGTAEKFERKISPPRSRSIRSGKDRANTPIHHLFIEARAQDLFCAEEETSRAERKRDDSATTTSYGVGSW